MLVIMYRDEISGVRYPGLFAILNNKKKEGYMLIFKKIKDIITIENSKELSLISYSVDYEQSLLDTCRTIFKDIRGVGCYYHYCRNLYKNAKRFNLIGNKEEKIGEDILKNFYSIPFRINDNQSYVLENLFKKLSNIKNIEIKERFLLFVDYYKTEWVPFIENGFLNNILKKNKDQIPILKIITEELSKN